MRIELVIIASEILNGKILDLNTHWLSSFLFRQGFELAQVTTIPDDPGIMKETLLQSLKRSDIVLTSGGLGPTKDDLTKDIVVEILDQKLVPREDALKITQNNYSRFKREYDQHKFHYHIVPEQSVVLNNPCGTAPGLICFKNNKSVASLPGVPKEFEEMFEGEIFPYLQNHYQLKANYQTLVTVKTKLIPESKIFSELCPTLWQELEKLGNVSSLPHLMGVDIGVMINAKNEIELLEKQAKALSLIQNEVLKSSIWHVGHEQLEEVIIAAAKAKNLTIGTVESCTGGLIAHRLTNVSGSSAVFIGSVVSYANSVKTDIVSVPKETIKNYGAVSLETVKAMADGGVKSLGAHIVVATSGIAGPTGGSDAKPVGTVCIGLKSNNIAHANSYQFVGDRVKLKERFAQMALFLLLDEIRRY